MDVPSRTLRHFQRRLNYEEVFRTSFFSFFFRTSNETHSSYLPYPARPIKLLRFAANLSTDLSLMRLSSFYRCLSINVREMLMKNMSDL